MTLDDLQYATRYLIDLQRLRAQKEKVHPKGEIFITTRCNGYEVRICLTDQLDIADALVILDKALGRQEDEVLNELRKLGVTV